MKIEQNRQKPVVAFVIWTLKGMGGSEKVVYDLARKLKERGYTIVIIALEDGGVSDAYSKIGARVRIADHIQKTARIRNLRKIMIEEKIDIANPHHFSPLVYSFAASLGLNMRFLYTEHSRWQLEQLPFPKKMLNRFILGRIDGVIALSKQIEDYYSRPPWLSSSKIHRITNGIDLSLYERSCNTAGLRKEIGISDNEKVIGTVAHLRPEKNHKLLISALPNLLGQGVNARLLFVGRDLMNGELQRFAASIGVLDRVLFLGERNDANRILHAFDVFCLPSRYEGMPLTLLEAMACEVAVVGANVLGINEVITNGENGLLFADNDLSDLTQTLLKILDGEGLRKQLIKKAKHDVQDYYSLNDKIVEYDELFRSVLPQGHFPQ